MGITLKKAAELAKAAIEYAEENSYLVSVAIVDEGGNEVSTARMDGAKFLSPSIARGKALASAAFRSSSGNVEKSTESKIVFYAGVSMLRSGEIAIGQGAFPLWNGDNVIGAIGVSGLAPELDEEVAEAALVRCGFSVTPTPGAMLAARGLSASAKSTPVLRG